MNYLMFLNLQVKLEISSAKMIPMKNIKLAVNICECGGLGKEAMVSGKVLFSLSSGFNSCRHVAFVGIPLLSSFTGRAQTASESLP
ncbi:MAG: hypothetical protein GY899_16330 [Verrucomicrobiaceae bacterium]|nr:hypothetical protein [Verrucomicrobiaceae bacterium]